MDRLVLGISLFQAVSLFTDGDIFNLRVEKKIPYDNIHGRPRPTAVRGKPRCRSEAIMNKCV